jgi:hypothetical protein
MKCFYTFIFFISFSSAMAEVGREQVDEMLKQMVKENVISEIEAKKASLKMKSMSDSEWSGLNAKAASMAASRKPASLGETIKDTKTQDLDGAQFKQIQDDIHKMMPDHQK